MWPNSPQIHLGASQVPCSLPKFPPCTISSVLRPSAHLSILLRNTVRWLKHPLTCTFLLQFMQEIPTELMMVLQRWRRCRRCCRCRCPTPTSASSSTPTRIPRPSPSRSDPGRGHSGQPGSNPSCSVTILVWSVKKTLQFT